MKAEALTTPSEGKTTFTTRRIFIRSDLDVRSVLFAYNNQSCQLILHKGAIDGRWPNPFVWINLDILYAVVDGHFSTQQNKWKRDAYGLSPPCKHCYQKQKYVMLSVRENDKWSRSKRSRSKSFHKLGNTVPSMLTLEPPNTSFSSFLIFDLQKTSYSVASAAKFLIRFQHFQVSIINFFFRLFYFPRCRWRISIYFYRKESFLSSIFVDLLGYRKWAKRFSDRLRFQC